MPARRVLPGDTIYVRAVALEVGSDALQVVIDDGQLMSITAWVPARECARHEDIGELKPALRPIRRASRYHEER
jgi:hypothetical protein